VSLKKLVTGNRETERKVSFLELFYDLVYVVLIAELAHTLVEHLSFESLANFAFVIPGGRG